MKDKNLMIRLGLTLVLGVMIIYKTYQFKFSNFIGDEVIYLVLVILGVLAWGLILFRDLKLYKKKQEFKYLMTSIAGGLFIMIALGISWNINRDLKKPTLVKVLYNGDYYGNVMDFKKDGTYIFDNYFLGSHYTYGNYQINGDEIMLDRNEIDGAIISNQLKILPVSVQYIDENKEEFYVFQVDESGEKIQNALEFRVTIDNRKRK